MITCNPKIINTVAQDVQYMHGYPTSHQRVYLNLANLATRVICDVTRSKPSSGQQVEINLHI